VFESRSVIFLRRLEVPTIMKESRFRSSGRDTMSPGRVSRRLKGGQCVRNETLMGSMKNEYLFPQRSTVNTHVWQDDIAFVGRIRVWGIECPGNSIYLRVITKYLSQESHKISDFNACIDWVAFFKEEASSCLLNTGRFGISLKVSTKYLSQERRRISDFNACVDWVTFFKVEASSCLLSAGRFGFRLRVSTEDFVVQLPYIYQNKESWYNLLHTF